MNIYQQNKTVETPVGISNTTIIIISIIVLVLFFGLVYFLWNYLFGEDAEEEEEDTLTGTPTGTPDGTPAGTPAETPIGTYVETADGTLDEILAETPDETPDGTPTPTPGPTYWNQLSQADKDDIEKKYYVTENSSPNTTGASIPNPRYFSTQFSTGGGQYVSFKDCAEKCNSMGAVGCTGFIHNRYYTGGVHQGKVCFLLKTINQQPISSPSSYDTFTKKT